MGERVIGAVNAPRSDPLGVGEAQRAHRLGGAQEPEVGGWGALPPGGAGARGPPQVLPGDVTFLETCATSATRQATGHLTAPTGAGVHDAPSAALILQQRIMGIFGEREVLKAEI